MTERLKAPGPRYRAVLQLLSTAEAVWNASRIFFGRWKLSPSQFNILNLLYGNSEGLSQTELSRRLITHRSNVTGLVDRLEARNLAKRLDQVSDRRAYRVVLTRAGRKLIERILPQYYEAAENVWGEFPAQRAKQMVADLERVSATAKQLAVAPSKLLKKPLE